MATTIKVLLLAPADGQVYTAPSTVALSAFVQVVGSTLNRVEFRTVSEVLFTGLSDGSEVVSGEWDVAEIGYYAVVARAIAVDGTVRDSSPVVIQVSGSRITDFSPISDLTITLGGVVPPIKFEVCALSTDQLEVGVPPQDDLDQRNSGISNPSVVPYDAITITAPLGRKSSLRELTFDATKLGQGETKVKIRVRSTAGDVTIREFAVTVTKRTTLDFLPENLREMPLYQKATQMLDWLIQTTHFDNLVHVENLGNGRSVHFDADYLLGLMDGGRLGTVGLGDVNKESLALVAANVYNLKGTKSGLQYLLALVGFTARVYEWFEVNEDPSAFGLPGPLPACTVYVEVKTPVSLYQDQELERRVDDLLRSFFWLCIYASYAWVRTIDDDWDWATAASILESELSTEAVTSYPFYQISVELELDKGVSLEEETPWVPVDGLVDATGVYLEGAVDVALVQELMKRVEVTQVVPVVSDYLQENKEVYIESSMPSIESSFVWRDGLVVENVVSEVTGELGVYDRGTYSDVYLWEPTDQFAERGTDVEFRGTVSVAQQYAAEAGVGIIDYMGVATSSLVAVITGDPTHSQEYYFDGTWVFGESTQTIVLSS